MTDTHLRRIPDAGLFAICSLIWGSTWFAITFQLGSVPPSASVGWRFLLAGCVLLIVCALRGESLRLARREYLWAALQGFLLFGVSYVCVYRAEQYIASGLMAVLNSMMLPFNLIGMCVAFAQPLGARSLLGAGLGVFGIVLVFWPELTSMQDSWIGVGFGLSAALLASLGNLVAQRNRNVGQPILAGTGLAMVMGGASALLLTVLIGEPIRFDAHAPYVFSLLYLALLGSVVAFLAYFTLIGRIGAGRAGYMAVTVPILALMISGAFEGLVWHVWTVAGVVCAALGNIVMLAPQTPPTRKGRA